MDPLLSWARAKQSEIVAFVRELVECESPTDTPAAVDRAADLVATRLGPLGTCRMMPGGAYGKHLICNFNLPGKDKRGQILALGHLDTVWPMGTLRTMPFREERGRVWGPGVLDMKSGVAFFVFGMQALRDLEIPVRANVVLQLNSDEEMGSTSSRGLTEAEARRSSAVLVLEPGTGLEGKLKTARKGIGQYRIEVRGIASHAGVDFRAGASAVLELARQIERVAAFTNLPRGVTVNPGLIGGGTRTNVVAAEAWVDIDVRVVRPKDAVALDKRFASLRPFDKRCTVIATGGLNRPPMERTRAIGKLFGKARQLAADLGVRLEESATGGGSDGNFTAGLGVPTLDGLGGVGEGAHADNESILVDRIADRTALLAKLVMAIH